MIYYSEESINDLCNDLSGLFNRKSTGKKVCRMALESIEVIRQLQREKRELEKDREWIPVTERTPKHGDFVLVTVSGFPADSISLENAIEIGSWCDDTGEWFLDAWPEWERPQVTHWMELPCGPEIREEIKNDN